MYPLEAILMEDKSAKERVIEAILLCVKDIYENYSEETYTKFCEQFDKKGMSEWDIGHFFVYRETDEHYNDTITLIEPDDWTYRLI